MPPHSPDHPAPSQVARPATAPADRARHSALTGGTGGFPHLGELDGETALGRHRRPESLADPTVLRSTRTESRPGGRRAAMEFTPRAAAVPRQRSASRSPATSASATWSSPAARTARGRHAASDPLAITVRPLPAMRDAAGAVRDWARADHRPVGGAHRAPGTLPIESWLLVGRRRQQALLAGLVAVGLMLVVVPMQRNATDAPVTAVNAAENAVVTAPKAPAAKKPQGKGSEPAATRPASPQEPAAPAAPAATAPAGQKPAPPAPAASAPAPAPASPGAPAIPAGDGPAKSLRTTGTDTVSLTFDDGPDPVQTPKILALLKEHQVTAMFCLVGDQARRHPDLVRDIAAAGHTLCNHSWNHSFTLGKDDPDKIRQDLVRTNDAIRAAVPDAKIPYFRAPGGNFTDRLVQTAYAEGMISLYWEVDPRDWEHNPRDSDSAHIRKIVRGVEDNVRPGSIVLSHDFGQPTTIEAYKILLPKLREKYTLGLPAEQPAAAPPAAAPPGGAPPAPGTSAPGT